MMECRLRNAVQNRAQSVCNSQHRPGQWQPASDLRLASRICRLKDILWSERNSWNQTFKSSIYIDMACLEYFRLHQHYVVAVRRCEQAELSSRRSGLLDVAARLTAEIKQKARNERNAAQERMVLHEQN